MEALQAADARGEALMRTESVMAVEGSIPWRERGPRGQDAPSTWRGQKWREGSQRYASRGGDPVKNAAFAAAAHAARLKGRKGKGENKADSKGHGKSTDASSGSKGHSKSADHGGKSSGSQILLIYLPFFRWLRS